MEKTKVTAEDVDVLRKVFQKYVELGGNWDKKAASIADTLLYEIGFIKKSSADPSGDTVRAHEAVRLLEMLPQSPERHHTLHFPSFPETRKVLWLRVIGGAVGGDSASQNALTSPGRISREEENILKDLIHKEFEKYRGYVPLRTWVVSHLCENSHLCHEVPLRAMLHFAARHLTLTEIMVLLA